MRESKNDLSPMWIEREYYHHKKLTQDLRDAYNGLKDHETSYAKGIWKMYKMRCEIVDVISKCALIGEE